MPRPRSSKTKPANSPSIDLSIGRVASLACLLEVCASKPGNVHRGADFADTTFTDFVVSAEVIGQAIDCRSNDSVGELIREMVSATSAIVGENTNLGMALLLGPLAITANEGTLDQSRVRNVLERLQPADSADIYAAIRISKPGGLGESSSMDVTGAAPESIVEAMRLATDRDLIARQYANGFEQVFDEVVPLLEAGQMQFGSITESIVYTHVSMLARYGDSLIARKLGEEQSSHARMLARKSLEQLINGERGKWYDAIAELDFWLRSDGNRRNPGTTADLIVAGLFAGIINNQLQPPFQ